MCSNASPQVKRFAKMTGNRGLPSIIDGGYPIIYLDENYELLCAECADASEERIDAYFVRFEGESIFCAECGIEVESAYGEVTDGA